MRQESFTRIVYILAFIATAIGFSAFSQNSSIKGKKSSQEIQANKDIAELDKQMLILDEYMKQLEKEMKGLDIQLKKLNIEKDISGALRKVNEDNMMQQVEQSLKSINENQSSIKEFEKVREIDMIKIKEELKKVNENLNYDKLNAEIKEQIDNERLKMEIERAINASKKEVTMAQVEISQTKRFIEALDEAGLIDSSKDFKVQLKDDGLYINGQKQSKEVLEKFRKYYRKENFLIENTIKE